jgi:hypothetical protein
MHFLSMNKLASRPIWTICIFMILLAQSCFIPWWNMFFLLHFFLPMSKSAHFTKRASFVFNPTFTKFCFFFDLVILCNQSAVKFKCKWIIFFFVWNFRLYLFFSQTLLFVILVILLFFLQNVFIFLWLCFYYFWWCNFIILNISVKNFWITYTILMILRMLNILIYLCIMVTIFDWITIRTRIDWKARFAILKFIGVSFIAFIIIVFFINIQIILFNW